MDVTVDVGKNITELLEKLATQIGVTVDKVWPWLVKQQVIEGYTFFVLYFVFLIIGIILLCIALKNDPFGDEFTIYSAMLLLATLFLVGIFCASIKISEAISQIFNPEYAAFKDLMRMIR